MAADEVSAPLVFRDRFVSTDLAEVEEFVCSA